jgi:hypothetical protein
MADLNELLRRAMAPSGPSYSTIGVATDTPGYDPVALAEYIKRKQALNQTPLFTDDANLAKKEDGFWVDTNTSVARSSAESQQMQDSKAAIPPTGNPIVDTWKKASAELAAAESQFNQELTRKLSSSSEARALETINRQIAIRQQTGTLFSPQELQVVANNQMLAQRAFEDRKNNLLMDPGLSARKRAIDEAKTFLAMQQPDVEAARQLSANDANRASAAKTSLENSLAETQQKLTVSPELSDILGKMNGTTGDPANIAEQIRTGNITKTEMDVATAINEGSPYSPKQYFISGDHEAGTAMSKFIVASTPEADRTKVGTVAKKLEGASFNLRTKAANKVNDLLTADQKTINNSKELSDANEKYSSILQGLKSPGSAATAKELRAQLQNTIFQEEMAQEIVRIRKETLSENLEILRPEVSWTAEEASIGNQLVDMLKNDSNPDVDKKMVNAVQILSQTGADPSALSSVVAKMQGVYTKRFNAQYSALGMTANPQDLGMLERSVLRAALDRIIKPASSPWTMR